MNSLLDLLQCAFESGKQNAFDHMNKYPQNNYSTDPEDDHRLKLWYKKRCETLSLELSSLKEKYEGEMSNSNPDFALWVQLNMNEIEETYRFIKILDNHKRP